jgi:phosphoribosyl 1,2-cyclic phosphate phosphodiesterase
MRDLEITFLGTGTSHGIPVIGCECRVCRSEDMRDKRLRTATLLRTANTALQIDTPPDYRFQCLREDITRLDAVIYTHSHTDHILGFDDLRRFCEIEDKEMPVYGSPATLRDLKRIFSYAFDPSYRYRNYVRPAPMEFTGPFGIGDLAITPVDLPHGRMLTSGLVFSLNGRKLLAYYTDCQSVPEAAIDAARGAEVLVLDALRHAPHTTHMALDAALAAAEEINAPQTYFIHMCHDLGHAETAAILPERIQLAFDGLRIEL